MMAKKNELMDRAHWCTNSGDKRKRLSLIQYWVVEWHTDSILKYTPVSSPLLLIFLMAVLNEKGETVKGGDFWDSLSRYSWRILE